MNQHKDFFDAYERWLAACLDEYNDAFCEARTLHTAPSDGNYDPATLVEFAEDGDAYPHGICGTNWIPRAVTPWADSPHYVE